LPIHPPKAGLSSLRDFLASQPLQTIPSKALLAEDREDRC